MGWRPNAQHLTLSKLIENEYDRRHAFDAEVDWQRLAIQTVGAIAESYALLAIEQQAGLRLPCRHPAIALVDDLEPIERLKLHILNLGHTVFAQCWMADRLRPDLTVREILELDGYRNLLAEIYGWAANGFRTKP